MYDEIGNRMLTLLFVLCLPLSWAASAIGSIYRWITIAIFCLFIIRSRANVRVEKMSQPMLLAMSALVAFSILSMIWGKSISDGIKMSLSFFVMFFVAIVFASNNYGKEMLGKKFDQCWIIVGIVSACLFIFGDRAQVGIYGSRTTLQILGTRTDPNEFAGLFAIPIAINVYYIFGLNKKKKAINVLAMLIEIYAVVLSGSRGALVACAMSIFVTIVICVKMTLGNILAIVAAISILIFVFFHYLLPLVPEDVIERMNIQVLLADGGGGRKVIWKSALDQYLNGNIFRILFGYGANGLIAQGERGATGAMHNYYLQLLTNYGVIGLSLYLNLFWKSIRKFWHCNRKYVAGLIAMAVLSLTLTTSPNYKPLWILMMMAMVPERNLSEMEEDGK